MVRKFSIAHVFGVGVLLCCAVLLDQAVTSGLRMLREAYIGWTA